MRHHALEFIRLGLRFAFRRHFPKVQLVENFLKGFRFLKLCKISCQLVKAPVTLLFVRAMTLDAVALQERSKQILLIRSLCGDAQQASQQDDGGAVPHAIR